MNVRSRADLVVAGLALLAACHDDIGATDAATGSDGGSDTATSTSTSAGPPTTSGPPTSTGATATGGTATDSTASSTGPATTDTASTATTTPATCEPACDPNTHACVDGTCVPLAPCAGDAECWNDSHCDPRGFCVPWDSFDPGCKVAPPPGVTRPTPHCTFEAAPPGDPFPNHVDVQAAPIVVNFDLPDGSPGIVAPFSTTIVNNYFEDLGVARILRGHDCSQVAVLGGTDLDGDAVIDWVVSTSTLAVGDLDDDGRAEIVAYGADGSLLAFTRKDGPWSLLWKATYPAGTPWTPCNPATHRCPLGWAGPSIHDLDGDGVPEVVREGVVFAADGALLSLMPAGYASTPGGLASVLADLDGDAAAELIDGRSIWTWADGWQQDPEFPGMEPSGPGHVAVADFGDYGAGLPPASPELVIVRDDSVMIQARNGAYAMPPVALPNDGGGGPPSVADVDGDGLAEVVLASHMLLAAYDIDCGPAPRPGGACEPGVCDHLGAPCPPGQYFLWSRAVQDSSAATGSAAFDFTVDGASEVVHADECFARIFDGRTGEVLTSTYVSSCAWSEYPIVADVDGDFRAEWVVAANRGCSPNGDGPACSGLDNYGADELFAGARCAGPDDCFSGVCDAGLCRCTGAWECCPGDNPTCLEAGHLCVPPPPGTPGVGDTCRAGHPHGRSGILVLDDGLDRWARTRPIHSQHAYAVTHVTDDGHIVATGAWPANWLDPLLNNFRENPAGAAGVFATGDLTADGTDEFVCTPAGVELTAEICNRGAEPIAAGVAVDFAVDGQTVCTTATAAVLLPGACEAVSCVWPDPPGLAEQAVDVDVVPNKDSSYSECNIDNNRGLIPLVYCAR